VRLRQTWYAAISLLWLVLIITARTVGGPAYQTMIEKTEKQLTRVVDDFGRAVNVEALRQTKEAGEHSFSHSLDRSFLTVPCRTAPFV
jgi:hypothetical protein